MATSKGGYVSGGFDILKAPNAPTITSVTASIGSASVAFTAPADVGGGAITSYTITAVDESTGASTGAVGSASPITISPGGGTFKIRAAATNTYGPGRVSQYDTGNEIYSGASLWAWGNNAGGQFGDNSTANRSSPIQVGALTDWSQVSANGDIGTVSSIKTNGTLWVWGNNANGILGQNDTVSRSSPVQLGALTNWAEVSTGFSNVAATKSDGTLWIWGLNSAGQLGQNNTISRSSPVQVGSLTNWYQVFAAVDHVMAVKTDGTLWGWGSGSFGKIGDGTVVYRSSPVQIGALTNWYQVSASNNHTTSAKTDGTLWAWGINTVGQLGQNNVTRRSSPVQVGALTNWYQVSAGNDCIMSVKTDGTLWGWGEGADGRLGTGDVIKRSSPVQVGSLTNWKVVSCARTSFAMALKTDGTLWTWGDDSQGVLGVNTINANKSSPVQVGALTGWYQVSAGSTQASALYGVV